MKQHLPLSTKRLPHVLSSCALGLSGALAISACQGTETHELGYTQSVQDLTNEPTAPFFTPHSDFVGRWVGEAVDPLALGADPNGPPPVYQFPSGSTSIALSIVEGSDSNGWGTLTGSITFGVGEPPPPATDPDVGYPDGFDYDALLSYGFNFPGSVINYDSALPPFEGFAYELSIRTIGIEDGAPDGVLQMAYQTSDFVGSWCELQTPQPRPDGSSGPLPHAPGGYTSLADGTNQSCQLFGDIDVSRCPENPLDLPPEVFDDCSEQPIIAEMSCDKIFLSQFCQCDALSCVAGSLIDSPAILLRSSGSGLVGVFDDASFRNPRGLATPIGEVHFRRVAD